MKMGRKGRERKRIIERVEGEIEVEIERNEVRNVFLLCRETSQLILIIAMRNKCVC